VPDEWITWRQWCEHHLAPDSWGTNFICPDWSPHVMKGIVWHFDKQSDLAWFTLTWIDTDQIN